MLPPSDAYILKVRQGPERAKVTGPKEKGTDSSGSQARMTANHYADPQTVSLSIRHPFSSYRSGIHPTLHSKPDHPFTSSPSANGNRNYLQSPYYFMCANLLSLPADGPPQPVSQTALAGTLVSSLHRLKDVDNLGTSWCRTPLLPSLLTLIIDGGFFVFGDLSVKVEGEYRLRFSLFEMRK